MLGSAPLCSLKMGDFVVATSNVSNMLFNISWQQLAQFKIREKTNVNYLNVVIYISSCYNRETDLKYNIILCGFVVAESTGRHCSPRQSTVNSLQIMEGNIYSLFGKFAALALKYKC